MGIKENSSRLDVNILKKGPDYDRFIAKEEMGTPYDGGRAKGKQRPDGSMVVAIDESYYRSGGIPRSQLSAIVEHERTELTSRSPDAHLDSTVTEYRHIRERFGPDGLRQYHSKLCNLMGGSNETRSRALEKVLGRG